MTQLTRGADRICSSWSGIAARGCFRGAAGVAWHLVRLAMLSRARIAVAFVQDLLSLDARARINTPGRMEGNWRWRMTPAQFAALPRQRLRALTEAFGRLDATLF